MIKDEITNELFKMQDTAYRDFQSKLIPTRDRESFIGIRTPQLRKYAKKLVKQPDIDEFLNDVPHKYFDEDQLHVFIVGEIKEFDRCISETEKFLPYIDNWATCDQFSPAIFKKHKNELLERIWVWLSSSHTYTVRFAIGMLMLHFLDEDYDRKFPDAVAAIRSDEYYINMMTAWYFATALAKQYDDILTYFTEHRLDKWTHNKAIQKATESNRITDEQKKYLRSLKI